MTHLREGEKRNTLFYHNLLAGFTYSYAEREEILDSIKPIQKGDILLKSNCNEVRNEYLCSVRM
ncbi:hypothetical protein Tsumi_13480 [Porphyromonas miyakawae]|uniref:Uncharacterized protein n=1 Tax=Porphyromonas miyakawae TaxID=3137470 RepID=A0ABQ0E3J1_9PORP